MARFGTYRTQRTGFLFTEFPKACLIMARIRMFVLDMLSLRCPLNTHFKKPKSHLDI